MKKKFNILLPIVTLFVGIVGTFLIIKNNPLSTECGSRNITEVSISETDTIKPAVEKIYDAVVTVQSYSNGMIKSLGTGVVYKTNDKYGYVLTNNHVINGASKITIVNNNGQIGEATLLGSDEYVDVAVLQIDLEYVMKTAEIGDSTVLEIGDTVFTVGTPVSLDYAGTVTKGIVSGKDRTVKVDLTNGREFMLDVIQTNAAINPGNSGGPLCNINGQIIGINTLKLVEDEIEGMGFAIPIEMITSVLDRLEQKETIIRPLLGVVLTDINNSYYLAKNGIYLDSSINKGAVILEVEENSTADKAGFKAGDVIVNMAGVEVNNATHFHYLLYKYEIGDKVKIDYYRDKGVKSVEVELSNRL